MAQQQTAAEHSTEESAAATYDVVVLGAGPGGYSAAFRAADLGLKVALVEQHPVLGGVCLNVGCIPSKALLHAVKVIDEAEQMAAHGIAFGKPKIDLERLNGWKRGVIKQLTTGLAGLAKQRKVEIVRGVGRLTGSHQLHVETEQGTRAVAFRHCILATGSRPLIPPALASEDARVMDSTGALRLEEIPGHLLIVGGGIIGLEMAAVYSGLGAKVTVVELSDRLMPGADRDLVKVLSKRLEQRCEAIHLETEVTAIQSNKKSLTVSLQGAKAPESVRCDRVLVAVGRRPNSEEIGLEAAGIEVQTDGTVAVDEQMRTAVLHIHAIGDLVGQPMLAHKAVHEGKIAAEVIAGERSAWDARGIPSVAYTDPEVAWIGVTEEEARAAGTAYEKGMFPWAANGRALSLEAADGLSKLLFDAESGRLIGGGIVGPGAGDLIAEVALALEMGADAHDIGLTVHPHPTLSETVAMAAEAVAGTLTDLPPKKRRS
ncbi:dihydrolipoyl dehydrogenase [Halorhodospira abdelmalekii]|nr:dihydrolipoyl dehydrogenase [Halorhodospira abdelmalekii]MBK1733998.1 dihydrolipoyl dehydrogenase [Halorhodospira abdelmalekii]